ncbi:MAG: hypothetical protein OEY28_12235, partial [Nitrospira sp.]|nr:hypothetical protein [Nitrospira sp.]
FDVSEDGMRKAVLCALFLPLVTVACGSDPEPMGRGPEVVEEVRARHATRWSRYLEVMSDKERLEFFEIDEDDDRDQWLRRNGLDVRADLHARLEVGLSVSAAKNRMRDEIDEEVRRGDETTLHYSRFNTLSRTNYYLHFVNDRLEGWDAYTTEAQDRDRGLREFEQRLRRRFDITLKVGMGPDAIRKLATNAQRHLDDVRAAHAEELNSGDYKGGQTPSSTGYIIDEQIRLAESRNALYAWFNNREPDEEIVHGHRVTHRYLISYKSLRGRTETVTVDFMFNDGRLAKWYVYHEE